MRVIILFDLPVLTTKNRRDYHLFRKYLIKMGFIMMQESVYTKLVQNSTVADSIVDNVRNNKPPEGIVQLLRITEKQYAKMEYIVGNNTSNIVESDERLIIL